MRTGPAPLLTRDERKLRRRHLPYLGLVVEVRWGGSPLKSETRQGKVISCGPHSLWIIAQGKGAKIEQDLFIKYRSIQHIKEVSC